MVFATNKHIAWKIRCDGYVKFNKLSKKQLNDPEIAKEVLKIDGSMLSKMNEENRDNERLVKIAVSDYLNPNVFGYASDRLKDDKEVLLKAAKNDGQSLYFASQSLRADKEVVLEAVKNKAIILKYASKELRNDKDVAIAAVTQNKKSLSYISDELKKDEDILKILNPE